MKFEYMVIQVDIGDSAEDRQTVSKNLTKAGQEGWRAVKIEHDVLGRKIVWLERQSNGIS